MMPAMIAGFDLIAVTGMTSDQCRNPSAIQGKLLIIISSFTSVSRDQSLPEGSLSSESNNPAPFIAVKTRQHIKCRQNTAINSVGNLRILKSPRRLYSFY